MSARLSNIANDWLLSTNNEWFEGWPRKEPVWIEQEVVIHQNRLVESDMEGK